MFRSVSLGRGPSLFAAIIVVSCVILLPGSAFAEGGPPGVDEVEAVSSAAEESVGSAPAIGEAPEAAEAPGVDVAAPVAEGGGSAEGGVEELSGAIDAPTEGVEAATQTADESAQPVADRVETAAVEVANDAQPTVDRVREAAPSAVNEMTKAVDDTATVNESSDPVKDATTAVDDTATAVNQTTARVREASPAVDDTVTAVNGTTDPVRDATTAVDVSATAVGETTNAVTQATGPIDDTAPAAREPSLVAPASAPAALQPIQVPDIADGPADGGTTASLAGETGGTSGPEDGTASGGPRPISSNDAGPRLTVAATGRSDPLVDPSFAVDSTANGVVGARGRASRSGAEDADLAAADRRAHAVLRLDVFELLGAAAEAGAPVEDADSPGEASAQAAPLALWPSGWLPFTGSMLLGFVAVALALMAAGAVADRGGRRMAIE